MTQDLMTVVEAFRKAAFPQPILADTEEGDSEPMEAYQASEYLVFVQALDVYSRHLEKTIEFQLMVLDNRRGALFDAGDLDGVEEIDAKIDQLEAHRENPVDEVVKAGVRLLRRLDAELVSFSQFMQQTLPAEYHKKLERTLHRPARNSEGAAFRARGLRGVLMRGGTKTLKGVFGKQIKLRRQVQEALSAVQMDDGDAALQLLAKIPIRHPKIRAWIDWADKEAKPLSEEFFPILLTPEPADAVPDVETPVEPGSPEAPVEVGAAQISTNAETLAAQQARELGTSDPGEVQQAKAAQTEVMASVEQEATEAAAKDLEEKGISDEPPKRSEVVGIATAAAMSAVTDQSNPQNIPDTLKNLDDEQRAAALTDGKVLVAASAGSGKTRTAIARIAHLVLDRGVDPLQILATTFNAKAGRELADRLVPILGEDIVRQMQTNGRLGTMHSVFLRIIKQHGNFQEQISVSEAAFQQDGSRIGRAVNRVWGACYGKDQIPRLKDMMQYKSVWAGNNVLPDQAMKKARDRQEQVAAKWYEWYEQFKKGDPKRWSPPCEEKQRRSNRGPTQWERYINTVRTVQIKGRPQIVPAADFDDMLSMARDILRRSPEARRSVQSTLSHVIVDECVHEDTEVVTREGTKFVSEVQPGDEILSFENGSAKFKKVLGKKRSSKSEGVAIQTASGHRLVATTNHRLYAASSKVPEGSLALYLMYRRDKGFRIGTSSRLVQGTGLRSNAEKADALWILEMGDPSEILFKEQAISLRYRVPTYVFEGGVHGCDQERIDRIFEEFGENGRFILEEYSLDFLYPHWANTTYTGGHNDRLVLDVKAHRGGKFGGTTVSVSWTGDTPEGLRNSDSVYEVKGGRKVLNKRLRSYSEARSFATGIANKCGMRVVEDVLIQDKSCLLMTASAILPGMLIPRWVDGWAEDKDTWLRGTKVKAVADKYHVPVSSQGAVSEKTYEEIRQRQIKACDLDPLPALDSTQMELDPVVEVEPVTNGVFYDLSIEDAANFFANELLSHNCQDLNSVQHEVIDYLTQHVSDDGSDGRSLWMVGDDKQCVASDTLVLTPSGEVPVDSLQPGMEVLSYRNGDVVSQKVRHVGPSDWDFGYKVTTEGGRTLTMSPNHKIWASPPIIEEGQKAMYLMYRSDTGFRVGVTNKGWDEDYNSFGGKVLRENVERMWVLGMFPDQDTAFLAEIGHKYGVPAMVFVSENHGINQERVDTIFSEFGRNGGRILEDLHLSFELPHWVSQSYSKHGRICRTVQMIAHASGNTQVSLEWDGDDLDVKLEDAGVKVTKIANTKMIHRYFANYREALSFAETLQRTTGANLYRRLSTPEGSLNLVTASALFPGMEVAVVDEGKLITDAIVSVERVEGTTFLDLDVDDASNFFGGGILSHNSIYSFRGARPDLFINLDKDNRYTTRMIKTNYRCEPEIVNAANQLISNNANQIQMEANANPAREKGNGSIRIERPNDEAEASISVMDRVKASVDRPDGDEYKNHAVLTRTNAELNSYETACIIRGIPYQRKGGNGFLESPETKAVLGYLDLVEGTDFESQQESLASVIDVPNRFFRGREGPEIIKAVFQEYARYTGEDRKSISPLRALNDHVFLEMTAQRLAKKATAVRHVERALNDLRESIMTMQANAGEEGATVQDLFNEILEMKGRTMILDPETGRAGWHETTLRESIRGDLKDSGEEEEDVDPDAVADIPEEAIGLGNITFLYKLTQVDPTDPEDLIQDPNTPAGFQAKMTRYQDRARGLKVPTDAERRAAERRGEPLPEAPKDFMSLNTVHSTKGLEWKSVYIPMPSTKFPIGMFAKKEDEDEEVLVEIYGLPPLEPPEEEEDLPLRQLQDERRLGYVAITRAEKNLTIICPKRVGGKPAEVSSFVAEAGLVMGENIVPSGDGADASVKVNEVTKTASLVDWYEYYEDGVRELRKGGDDPVEASLQWSKDVNHGG